MIPIDPYWWTAYLLGVLTVALILTGALAYCHLQDWRVSTVEEEPDVRPIRRGDLIPVGEDGDLEQVVDITPKGLRGEATIIETESI